MFDGASTQIYQCIDKKIKKTYVTVTGTILTDAIEVWPASIWEASSDKSHQKGGRSAM